MLAWILIIGVLTGILAFFVIMNLFNLHKMQRLEHYPDLMTPKRLSVIVPARNEEKNIEQCVRSLLGQTGREHGAPGTGGFELIVVDDSSTDATGAILRRIAREDSRLSVLQGQALPKGWTGKNWACWQGFCASRGDVLLFTDADTRHEPTAVARAAYALLSSEAGLLSAIVHQETRSFGEKTLIPILFWLVYSLFPFPLMNANASVPLSFGNGQFMMFRRETYLAIGGHQGIRNNVFDDMTLAHKARRNGMKTLVLDGSRFVSCRMYRGMAEAFEGLCKNIFMLFRYVFSAHVAVPLYVAGLTVFALTIFAPILSLLIDCVLVVSGFPLSAAVIALSSAGILLSWATLFIVYTRFRFPISMILLYPLSITVFLATALASMIMSGLGKTVWKGRTLELGGLP